MCVSPSPSELNSSPSLSPAFLGGMEESENRASRKPFFATSPALVVPFGDSPLFSAGALDLGQFDPGQSAFFST